MADKNELEMKACCPSNLVRYVTGHLKQTFEKSNVKMVTQVEAGTCMMEPDLVQTLLINLLDNARKSMEQGGTIYITAEMTAVGCRFIVRDEGKGIPPEAMKHLTEAFLCQRENIYPRIHLEKRSRELDAGICSGTE